MINIRSLDRVPLAHLTESWNRCWQGYYYDMSYMQEHLQAWLELGQVALSRSMALFEQKRVIGFALLALDGEEGWIAGTAIDPVYRRRGLFEPLMEAQVQAARALGLKRLYLDVFPQNHALKTYERAGFTILRSLYIYQLSSETLSLTKETPSLIYEAELDSYFAFRRQSRFLPSWQRREHFLARHQHCHAYLNNFGSFGFLLSGKQNVLLDAWSSTDSDSEKLISELLEYRTDFTLTNQPETDPVSRCLSGWGVTPLHIYEMVHEL